MTKTSLEQMRLIIAFMKAEGDISQQAVTLEDRREHNAKWEEIVRRLNRLNGAKRDFTKWKRVWSDMKANTKKKAARIHKMTSHGVECKAKLLPTEVEILNIMKKREDIDPNIKDECAETEYLDVNVDNEIMFKNEEEDDGNDDETEFKQTDMKLLELNNTQQNNINLNSMESLDRCKLELRKREIDLEGKKIQLALEQTKDDREYRQKKLELNQKFMDAMLASQKNIENLCNQHLEEQKKIISVLVDIKRELCNK